MVSPDLIGTPPPVRQFKEDSRSRRDRRSSPARDYVFAMLRIAALGRNRRLVTQTVSPCPDGRFFIPEGLQPLAGGKSRFYRDATTGHATLETIPDPEGIAETATAGAGTVGISDSDDSFGSLLRSEGVFGGRLLSTNILPRRGSWSCAMQA